MLVYHELGGDLLREIESIPYGCSRIIQVAGGLRPKDVENYANHNALLSQPVTYKVTETRNGFEVRVTLHD